MNYKEELEKINQQLLSIRLFDLRDFIYNYQNMVRSIKFFHNVIGKNAKNTKELSSIKFDINKDKLPNVGQVAYFQIEHSYPKEIYNGHWCLVMKNFGNTMLVIPLTSIKEDSIPVDKSIEMEVKIKNFEEDGNSKLKIHQMFCADLMRLDQRKNIYNLETDFHDVKTRIKEILNW